MEKITVEAVVNAPRDKVWEAYTQPAHITQWNHASDDWHCPWAKSDLRAGGSFSSRMEAKDGSAGFDFAGTYDEVVPQERIVYSFGGRKAEIIFKKEGESVRVVVSFEPETENPIEMQRGGWQAILDNFKTYAESLS
jgi:uncharacterized protein YndB with AHSA1/START domain